MEEITDGVNAMNLGGDSHKKNRIQVSNTKKPLFFYVNLAKVYLSQTTSILFDLGFGYFMLVPKLVFFLGINCNVGYDLPFL